MHPTAMHNCKMFFDAYAPSFFSQSNVKVIEIGSQDVNGSLRSVAPGHFEYVGVDFVAGKGVDVILDDPYHLPFDSESADIVLSSSCFEHSEMFWLVFLEIMRILKPKGLFYLNVPSNGMFHRYPVDCWRFYPDSGGALVNWAKKNGIYPALLESYTSAQAGDKWNDFVAIFIKEETMIPDFMGRILHTKKDITNGVLHNRDGFLSFSEFPEDVINLHQEKARTTTQFNAPTLSPVYIARRRQEFEEALSHPQFADVANIEAQILTQITTDKAYSLEGFCIPCQKKVPFVFDMLFSDLYGGQKTQNGWVPNWRERLICQSCNMNNRMRLMAAVVKQKLACYSSQAQVYLMEQATPFYRWMNNTFSRHEIIGSEYLGDCYTSGEVINGLRHENAMQLSFSDVALDLIISNDVFEHISEPKKAFMECARVLRPGGIMLITVPFYTMYDESLVRAIYNNGELQHLHDAVFHFNPISEKGSLVFTDFGWDMFDSIKAAGFSDAYIEVYANVYYGHLRGIAHDNHKGGQLIFKMVK